MMEPLSLEKQILRQIEKGCCSSKETIERYLKITSYFTINYDYEPYITHSSQIIKFKIQDYKWLEETNEKISKESLSLILRSEKIVRNKIADYYSFFCKNNQLQYFSIDSFVVDKSDFPELLEDADKNKLKMEFIDDCWNMYLKKKKNLNSKYHFDSIENVPPFVIAQHLSFGQIRKFYKLLNKDIKEKLVASFNLKISEFSPIIEKLNFLRNACAHGDFILNFTTQKLPNVNDKKFHHYMFNSGFNLKKNKTELIPLLSYCSYLLQDNISFFLSTMRNILEMANYTKSGSLNKSLLLSNLGLLTQAKSVQCVFV